MNRISSLPTDAVSAQAEGAIGARTPRRRGARAGTHATLLPSLSVVLFVFGGLLAMQLRAYENVTANRERAQVASEQANAENKEMRTKLNAERQQSRQMKEKFVALQGELAKGFSPDQARQITSQLHQLQLVAGLTPVSGPGIVIKLNDSPLAAGAASAAGGFLPGLVHDFDLLQVVNELRTSKAEAIAINGVRITGYTPIRCVGPQININWELQPAPFTIEAVGNPDVLYRSLKMAGGVLDTLKREGTLDVKIAKADSLSLPAADTVPQLKIAGRLPALPGEAGTDRFWFIDMLLLPLLIPVIAFAAGFMMFYIPPHAFSADETLARYTALAVLAGFDTILGGLVAYLKDQFDEMVFVTGFFANALLAALLVLMGERLGLETGVGDNRISVMMIGAVVVFSSRIFNNLAALRRLLIEQWRTRRHSSAEAAKPIGDEASLPLPSR